MDFDLVTNVESCYLAIQENPHLLYYSHIPTAVTALLLGIFTFFKNRHSLVSKLLLTIGLLFALWCGFDLILWMSTDSRKITFFWSIINQIENMVTITALYFAYSFLEKKDVSFKYKLFFGLLFLPLIVLIPTSYNITGFNDDYCEAGQGILIRYFYFIEVFTFLWLLIYLIRKIFSVKGEERKQVVFFSVGVVLFMASFSGANIAGSVATLINPDNPDNWKILQYGLFGMPVFTGLLAYLIVRYKAFDVKLISAQALVAALVILIGSQFFFIQTDTNKILTGITLTLATGFGYMLIQSVKLEIKRKEELQMITERLAKANDRLRELDNAKSEFVSIASHQLRTPLTSIKGFISLLMEGSYGELKKEHRDILTKVYTSNERLIHLVEDLLNLSRIESGRMEYNFEKIQLGEVCQEIYDTFTLKAKDKKLFLKLKIAKDDLPAVTTDRAKIVEVISNLVDNALKYTLKGGVEVRVEKSKENNNYVRVCVKDTGIGVPKEEIPYLFAKFSRGKDTSRLNAAGTGLGLHVGKRMIEALQGRILVESEGQDKGSTFIVEVPIERAG